ncbi:MAG: hypothetical protein LW825_05010 [Candidatus Jidaibacter sp.]|jgi:hypothetical protein|nr:hypothetical protein [Candidatus Jidaibacter sp.]
MKVICYTHAHKVHDNLAVVLEKEGYDVVSTDCESALWGAIHSNQYLNSIVLYHVSNDNFADCYRSLNGILRARPGSLSKPEVILLADDSVEKESLKLLSKMVADIISLPVKVDRIIERISKYKSYLLKINQQKDDIDISENSDKFHELLNAMKSELERMKSALEKPYNVKGSAKNERSNMLNNIQKQINKLDVYLSNKKLHSLKYIIMKPIVENLFKEAGWSEINYRQLSDSPKIKVDYEYFEKALKDLVLKIIQIAGKIENLSVVELLQQGNLIMSFIIKNINTKDVGDLLHYKNFDFCQKVMDSHAGELFIKHAEDSTYITIRLPVEIL